MVTDAPHVLELIPRDAFNWDGFVAEAKEPHCSVALVPGGGQIVVVVSSSLGLTEHAFDESMTLRDAVRDALAAHLGPVHVRFRP